MNDQSLRSNVSAFRDLVGRLAVTDTVSFAGGQMFNTNGSWSVALGGATIPIIWLDSVNPHDGQQCFVAIITPAGGLPYALMLGGVSGIPNAGEIATVNSVATTTAQVTISGATYTANRLSCYTPVVNDVAFVVWRSGIPYLFAAITAAPPPPPIVKPAPPPPPPPAKTYGVNNYPCVSSGTWTTGYNWNSYFGSSVYSGSGYVPPSEGTWFYNGATRSLASRTTINYVSFYLGPRRQAGSYNNTVTVHFYVSSDNYKSGQPHLVTSAHDVNIAPGWGGGWIGLPASFGTSLKAGGSITIAGDPYVGFTAGSASPSSGALKIGWTD